MMQDMEATQQTWQRIEDGYQSGRFTIYDNGAGVGPSRGSGRWALMVDGRWCDNFDTLDEAKKAAH